MTAIYLQTPKAAAAKPRPVQPRTPTTPAEDSSDSSSEVSEVSGESQLEGEGVAEAIGAIRSCQDKGESLWTPGVVSRVFGTPELPHRVFPEAAAAAVGEKSAGITPEEGPLIRSKTIVRYPYKENSIADPYLENYTSALGSFRVRS